MKSVLIGIIALSASIAVAQSVPSDMATNEVPRFSEVVQDGVYQGTTGWLGWTSCYMKVNTINGHDIQLQFWKDDYELNAFISVGQLLTYDLDKNNALIYAQQSDGRHPRHQPIVFFDMNNNLTSYLIHLGRTVNTFNCDDLKYIGV